MHFVVYVSWFTGCPVSTHLLNRLYEQGHLRSAHNEEAVARLENAFGPTRVERRRTDPLPKVVMLGICESFLVFVSRLNERKEEGHTRTDFSSPLFLFGFVEGGVHVGPLAYLNSSSVVMPYLQYFENAAAHELFEFQVSRKSRLSPSFVAGLTRLCFVSQDTESAVSRAYTASLSSALDHGVKFVYVASLNDQ